MIYPDIKVEDWCKKYKISVKEDVCEVCNQTLVANIPFLDNGWAGLVSDSCQCKTSISISKPTKKDLIKNLEYFTDELGCFIEENKK